jgi:hypothetical protein
MTGFIQKTTSQDILDPSRHLTGCQEACDLSIAIEEGGPRFELEKVPGEGGLAGRNATGESNHFHVCGERKK